MCMVPKTMLGSVPICKWLLRNILTFWSLLEIYNNSNNYSIILMACYWAAAELQDSQFPSWGFLRTLVFCLVLHLEINVWIKGSWKLLGDCTERVQANKKSPSGGRTEKGKQTLFVHLAAASAWIKRPSKYTRTVYSKHKYVLSFLFWHSLWAT